MQVSANTEAVDIDRPKLAVGISLVAGKHEKQDDAIVVSSVEVMNGHLVGGTSRLGGTSEDIDVQGWGHVDIGFVDIRTLRKKVWVRKGGEISLVSLFS